MTLLKRCLAALLAVGMLFTLAACGNDENSPEKLKGGELIVEENENIMHLAITGYDTLHPLLTESATVQECISLIYEPLFDFDEAFNPVPVLAQDYTVSADGMELTVELAADIQWSDGAPFTAQDVVYTVESIKDRDCIYYADLRNITAVTAHGKDKVVFSLAKPLLNPELFLSFPVLQDGTRFAGGTNFVPIGTGAYRLDKEKTTTNAIVLTANGNWHGGKPAIGQVVLHVVKDSDAAVYAFEANEVNVLTAKTLNLQQSSPRNEFYTYSYTTNTLLFLGVNHVKKVWQNADVRQVLGFVLHKQEMLDNEMYGRAVETDVPVIPSAWFAQKADKSRREQADINQMMLTAGWQKEEDGFYYKVPAQNTEEDTETEESDEKEKLTASILVNEENTERVHLAERIAAQLTTAGMETTVKSVSFSEYQSRIRAGDFSLFLGEVMLEKNMDPTFLTGDGNYFGYENPDLNAALEPAARTKDTEVRRQCFAEYTEKFLKEAPFVPLFFRTENVVYDKTISGNRMPTMFRPYRALDTWYFSKREKGSQ